MKAQLELYGSRFCHLCDQAKEVLKSAGILAVHIDISDDDVLVEKYGMRIPVLRRMDHDTELGWPFDNATVLRFLL